MKNCLERGLKGIVCVGILCVLIVVIDPRSNKTSIQWRNACSEAKFMVYAVPSIIWPTNFTFDGFSILDFVLIYNGETNSFDSLFLSGHRKVLRWNSIDCFYLRSNVSLPCRFDRRLAEPSITCPLPREELVLFHQAPTKLRLQLKLPNDGTSSPVIEVPVYPRRPFNISLYTMIKNKKNELIEWIEYHALLGIEHFYLYNNLGDDHVESFLRPYLDRGLVTIVQWPFVPLPNEHWNMIQSASMNHMLKNFGPFNRWIGYFDVDEYFFPSDRHFSSILGGEKSLVQLFDEHVSSYGSAGAIQFFNCPMSCTINQDELLNDRFMLNIEKCQTKSLSESCSTRSKMFIRPSNVPLMQNIHALSLGEFVPASRSEDLARFRHYHYGSVGSNLTKNENLPVALRPHLDRLRQRVFSHFQSDKTFIR